jgi:cytochrome c biogenesis protein CcmG/thiol:disulfide interchange protein DsbE
VNRRPLLPIVLAAAGLLLAAVAILGLLQNRGVLGSSTAIINSIQQSVAGETAPKDSQSGKPAPEFELASLNGQPVHLSDFKGHPVLINYWATWCPPCREELPLIQSRHEKYSSELVVLAINAGEDLATVKNYVQARGFTFSVLLDPEWKAEALFGIMAYPTSVFIDQNGIIQARYVGGLNEKVLDDNLGLIGVGK